MFTKRYTVGSADDMLVFTVAAAILLAPLAVVWVVIH